VVNVFRRLCLKPDKPVSYPFAWVSPWFHRMTLFVAPVGDFLATQLAPVSPRSYQEVTRKSEWAEPPTIWLSTDEDEAFEPVGLAPVSTVEDYCAFLFLSGQTNITEAAYNIFRMLFNAERANGAGRLRCITTIRRQVAPAMREAWGLPLQMGSIPATDATGDPKSVYFILPSTHVKRDVSFRGTYDLFFAALGPDADGTLEPEYYHSMMHLKRKMVTCPLQLPHFNFDGNMWTVGGLVNILLTGGT